MQDQHTCTVQARRGESREATGDRELTTTTFDVPRKLGFSSVAEGNPWDVQVTGCHHNPIFWKDNSLATKSSEVEGERLWEPEVLALNSGPVPRLESFAVLHPTFPVCAPLL